MDDEIEKLYFSIGDVSKKLGVTIPQIRFWEKEFIQLKPAKSLGGTRKFTHKDIEIIKVIYVLIKEQGYTIDGAKEKLKNDSKLYQKQALIGKLKSVKQFLLNLKNEL